MKLRLLACAAASCAGAAQAAPLIDWNHWSSSRSGWFDIASDPLELAFDGTAVVGLDRFPSHFTPSSTFADGVIVENAPLPGNGILMLSGGSLAVQTLTFSRPVVNPVMAIWSLGAPDFNASFIFLGDATPSLVSGGPNAEYGGQSILIGNNVVSGAEGNGTIQFEGTFQSISWVNPVRELWYGFNVGVPGCRNYELAVGSMDRPLTVPADCSAFTQGSFVQNAVLDVDGTYRALGNHAVWGALLIGDGGRIEHAGLLELMDGGHLLSQGSLSGAAVVVRRGSSFATMASGNWRAASFELRAGATAVVDSMSTLDGQVLLAGSLTLGQNTLTTAMQAQLDGAAARVTVSSGATWDARGGLRALDDARLDVAGKLLAGAGLDLLDGATLNVAAGGQIELRGGGRLAAATLRNSGRVLQTGGRFEVEARGTLHNAGHWQLDRAGTIQASPFSEVNNVGTMQIDGLLAIDGATLLNQGRIAVGNGGALEITLASWRGSGRIDIGNDGNLRVASEVSVPSGAHIAIANGGRADLQGSTIFTLSTGSRLDIATGGRLDLGPTSQFDLATAGQVVNDGLIVGNGGLIRSAGLFSNRPGAHIANVSLIQVNGGNFDIGTGVFVHAGTFVQTGGIVTINGTLVTGSAFLGGMVLGNGVILGPAFIGSPNSEIRTEVRPGQSPGTLTFASDLELTQVDVVIELDDWWRQDRLVVGGRLLLDRVGVRLQSPAAYRPDLNDRFDWLSVGNGIAGEFEVAQLPALADGWRFERVSTAGDLGAPGGESLHVWNDAAQALALVQVDAGEEQRLAAGRLLYLDGSFGVRAQGRLAVEGALAVRTGARVAVDAGAIWTIEPGGRVSNRGQLDLDGYTVNAGLLRNYAGGTVRVATVGLVNQGRFETAGTVINQAAIVNAPGSELIITETGVLQADGTDVLFRDDGGHVHVDGLLQAPRIVLSGTHVTGKGRLQGVVEGTATFGLSASDHLTIAGELRGVFEFELAARDDLSFGSLAIEGDARLQGGRVTLVLSDGGWTPAIGNEIVWLTVDQGVFQGLQTLDWRIVSRDSNGDQDWRLPAGLGVEFGGDRFRFVAVPVPEPGPLALMLAGLGALGALRARGCIRA